MWKNASLSTETLPVPAYNGGETRFELFCGSDMASHAIFVARYQGGRLCWTLKFSLNSRGSGHEWSDRLRDRRNGPEMGKIKPRAPFVDSTRREPRRNFIHIKELQGLIDTKNYVNEVEMSSLTALPLKETSGNVNYNRPLKPSQSVLAPDAQCSCRNEVIVQNSRR